VKKVKNPKIRILLKFEKVFRQKIKKSGNSDIFQKRLSHENFFSYFAIPVYPLLKSLII
jgi:hypothetical protein